MIVAARMARGIGADPYPEEGLCGESNFTVFSNEKTDNKLRYIMYKIVIYI
jgi:hypothetical protein